MLIEGLKHTESAMAEVTFVCTDAGVEGHVRGLPADRGERRALGKSMGDRDGRNDFQRADSGGDLMSRDIMASARLDVQSDGRGYLEHRRAKGTFQVASFMHARRKVLRGRHHNSWLA